MNWPALIVSLVLVVSIPLAFSSGWVWCEICAERLYKRKRLSEIKYARRCYVESLPKKYAFHVRNGHTYYAVWRDPADATAALLSLSRMVEKVEHELLEV